MNIIRKAGYLSLLALLAFTLCVQAQSKSKTKTKVKVKAVEEDVKMEPLESYFIGNNVPPVPGTSFKIFTTDETFSDVCHPAATNHSVEIPDFDKNDVWMIAMPPSPTKYDLKFDDAKKEGNTITVHCSAIKGETDPGNARFQFMALTRVPKYEDVAQVKFFVDGKLSKTVAMKAAKIKRNITRK